MTSVKDFQFNPFQTNCYIIWDESLECVICDPGMCCNAERGMLDGFISSKGLKPVAVVLTHGHGDHCCGVGHCISKYEIPAYMSAKDRNICRHHEKMCVLYGVEPYDSNFTANDVHEEDKVSFGSHELIAIECPGHTPGGVAWLCIEERLLLSGDSLFKGAIGRTDLEGGDYDALMESLRGKLMGLAGDIDVLPGHGPQSNIAEEVQTNPFLQPFNEPYDPEEAAGNAIEPGFGDEE